MEGRHHRHSDLMHTGVPAQLADLAWAGILRVLFFFCFFRVKMDVAGAPQLAAGREFEAPTEGSVIMAAIPPKMGGIRFPELSLADVSGPASHDFAPLIFSLSVSPSSTPRVAMMQEDIKKLIAILLRGAYGLRHHGDWI